MKKSTLAIHSENILPIIKKWLYSDKDIFLRELVSNACDALNKIKILKSPEESELKISIKVDKPAKTITISDTGIGMTAEEVEKYIAQIAFSGAEEFVQKYKSQTEKDPIIGHFGLGFYSAYMVAKTVEINTLSFEEGAKPVFWSCDGSATYSIGEGKRSERGTEITLHIDDESLEYLEESKIKELLNRYCPFMPFPIELNGNAIGNKAPLWMKSPSECKEADYLEFYRSLFPMDPDPIFWIHLNVDYPFTLKGILYFPKMHRRYDVKESTIKLFCNRVFVSDNCKDILPDYLTILKGAIDSPDIPLNVSRSYLQVDKNVKQLSSHISKKVSDRLTSFYRTDREKFITAWPDIEMIVKLGILQDDKFYDRIQEALIWKNSKDEWTTGAEYLSKNGKEKIFYTSQTEGPFLKAFQDKNIEFIYANSYIDTALIQTLEDKLSCKFQRLDGAIEEALLDKDREKTLLDADGKTEGAKIADFIRTSLGQTDVEVEAKSLASDFVPGLVILDEQQRRFRDYMSLTQGQKLDGFVSKKTFVVNTNNKLIQAIEKLQTKKPEIATDLAKHLYDLSLFSQKELDPKDAEKVLSKQTEILEKMASLLV